jgi:hypothetical protein
MTGRVIAKIRLRLNYTSGCEAVRAAVHEDGPEEVARHREGWK